MEIEKLAAQERDVAALKQQALEENARKEMELLLQVSDAGLVFDFDLFNESKSKSKLLSMPHAQDPQCVH